MLRFAAWSPLINSPGLITMAWIVQLRQHILIRRCSSWWRNVVLDGGVYWRRGRQVIIKQQKDRSHRGRTCVLAWHWHSSPTPHQPCAWPFCLHASSQWVSGILFQRPRNWLASRKEHDCTTLISHVPNSVIQWSNLISTIMSVSWDIVTREQ